MSYSFGFKVATKDEVVARMSEEFNKITVVQPSHEVDKQMALDTATAIIALIEDPKDGESITISCNGSLNLGANEGITGASFHIKAFK